MATEGFELMTLRDYDEDVVHLQNMLQSLDVIGIRTTSEFITLFCLMYFKVPVESVTKEMRKFARTALRVWTGTGKVNPEWTARYLAFELAKEIYRREEYEDFTAYGIERIRGKVAPPNLIEAIRSRYSRLLERYGPPPTLEIERASWARKIRIKQG